MPLILPDVYLVSVGGWKRQGTFSHSASRLSCAVAAPALSFGVSSSSPSAWYLHRTHTTLCRPASLHNLGLIREPYTTQALSDNNNQLPLNLDQVVPSPSFIVSGATKPLTDQTSASLQSKATRGTSCSITMSVSRSSKGSAKDFAREDLRQAMQHMAAHVSDAEVLEGPCRMQSPRSVCARSHTQQVKP